MASFESQSDRGKEAENSRSQESTLPAVSVSGEEGSDSRRKRPKKKTYAVWENFSIINKVHNRLTELRAQCKHCLKDYTYDSHKHGTVSNGRHSLVCARTPRPGNPVDMQLGPDGKLVRKKLEQTVFRDMLARCVIEHALLFSFVEYSRVRLLMQYLNPEVECISRKTVAFDVFKLYEFEKQKLKLELSNIPGRVSFTSDLWTTITVEGYMCLTAHYVDREWKLQNKILSFVALPPPHTGMDMAMKMLELWKEWGVEKKVFSITLDNASNNDTMQNILRQHLVLEDSLFCNGEHFHLRCCAHILNLIVQKGLKVIQPSLQKIRDSVKYVQASESRRKLFDTCVSTVGLKIKAFLLLDVPTRWNSTDKMLARAILYRTAFDCYQNMDPNYTLQPTDEEWDLGLEICELLQLVDEITNMFSGSTYLTANLYFMQVYKIKYWLKVHENSSQWVIAEMVGAMKQQFDKYWHDYSDILAIAAVLDPRFKMSLLEFIFSNLSEESCEAEIANVRDKMKRLFQAYKGTHTPSPPRETNTDTAAAASAWPAWQQSTETEEEGFLSHRKSIMTYVDFHNFWQKNVEACGKSPLDIYLDEPTIDIKLYANLNVLDYWKDNVVRFGELSVMACDILSIPITMVASESSFSIGSRVLNKYRSCLLPKNVQALLCARSWLRGFTAFDNELEGFDITKEHELSHTENTSETVTSFVDSTPS